jgi:hypothetical protein
MSDKTYTTKNGKTYKLEMLENTILYYWKGSGNMHHRISGGYLTKPDAMIAMQQYDDFFLNKKERIEIESTPLIELDKLSKKLDLLEFASQHGIHVPNALTKPVQIKRLIKDNLEAVSAES